MKQQKITLYNAGDIRLNRFIPFTPSHWGANYINIWLLYLLGCYGVVLLTGCQHANAGKCQHYWLFIWYLDVPQIRLVRGQTLQRVQERTPVSLLAININLKYKSYFLGKLWTLLDGLWRGRKCVFWSASVRFLESKGMRLFEI